MKFVCILFVISAILLLTVESIDTIQNHYETIVNDVIGEHNEVLLGKLSMLIKKEPTQIHTTLKYQAEALTSIPIQDACIAQMPGKIAYLIQELNNELDQSIQRIVSQQWTVTKQDMTQLILGAMENGFREHEIINELADALEVVNMDMTDDIMSFLKRFDLLLKLKSGLLACHESLENSLKEKLWSAVLLSFKQELPVYSMEQDRYGFMMNYLKELVPALQSELYSRVYDLAYKLYEDLAIL